MRLLRKMPLDDQALQLVAMVQASVGRMGGLIDNLVDFARFRLGGRLLLEREQVSMEDLLVEITRELQVGLPDRLIETAFRFDAPILCDRRRMAQLVSNLLGNALTRGAADRPVRLSARTEGGWFELSVASGGEPSLYIAQQIAEAHGGVIEAASTPAETRFTLRMPVPE